MKKVEIRNRDGRTLVFEPINDTQYHFADEMMCRIGGNEYKIVDGKISGNVDFIDPSGGPFIQIGAYLTQTETIQQITIDDTDGFIITVEKR